MLFLADDTLHSIRSIFTRLMRVQGHAKKNANSTPKRILTDFLFLVFVLCVVDLTNQIAAYIKFRERLCRTSFASSKDITLGREVFASSKDCGVVHSGRMSLVRAETSIVPSERRSLV